MKSFIAIIVMIAMLLLLTAIFRMLFKIPLWLLAAMSGWRELSAKYPDKERGLNEQKLRFCSIRIRGIDYRSCVNILLSQESLTLSIGFPFRDFHPNICIPRSQLLPSSRTTMWLTEYTVSDMETSIWFDKRVSQRLQEMNAKG